ncbi:hypothetical protein RchiOBHm_Chr5g0053571 [Rosa chinensis]|uniref:Uncharacterized protein n=1 Tax=Rosa chinensis TaxID=74649 RepID=A0A2P6QFX6_ROSCH|nr:hypothetical protein RchiOBHm_Chr5g0053571 [Rosa chinensis]
MAWINLYRTPRNKRLNIRSCIFYIARNISFQKKYLALFSLGIMKCELTASSQC